MPTLKEEYSVLKKKVEERILKDIKEAILDFEHLTGATVREIEIEFIAMRFSRGTEKNAINNINLTTNMDAT
jgi:hypothetical protein